MIQSVDRALKILDMFLEHDDMSLTEIANNMQLSKSTVSGLVSTLETNGYLERKAHSLRYVLGTQLFRLGSCYSNRLDYKAVAHSFLYDLCQRTNLTVNMAMLRGRNVIYVDNIDPRGMIEFATKEGNVLPAHCTATGKSLLSSLSNEEVRRRYEGVSMEALTKNSITTVDDLIQDLERIRIAGYSIDNFESDVRTFGCGVLVRDAYGGTPVAISVGGLVFSKQDVLQIRESLSDLAKTAEKISQRLGH